MGGAEASTSFGFSFLIQSAEDLEEFFSYIEICNTMCDGDFYFSFFFDKSADFEDTSQIIAFDKIEI